MKTSTTLRIVVILGLITFLTGCLRSEIRLQVRPNGTGVISYTYEMQEEFALMMIGLMNMGAENSPATDAIFYSIEDVKAQAETFGPDVQFVRLVPLENPGFQGYRAEYLVHDVNTLRINQTPASPEGEQNDDAVITFRHEVLASGDSKLTVLLPPRVESPQATENTQTNTGNLEESLAMLEVYRGMKASILVEPIGTLVDTDATRTQGNRISILELDFGQLFESPEAMETLALAGTNSMDQALGYLEGYDGIFFESKPEISATYR